MAASFEIIFISYIKPKFIHIKTNKFHFQFNDRIMM